MTLVYDDGVFKPQGPVPDIKNHAVVHVVIINEEAPVAAEGAEDGWTMMRRLQGCITETTPGEPSGRDHDKYLYGR